MPAEKLEGLRKIAVGVDLVALKKQQADAPMPAKTEGPQLPYKVMNGVARISINGPTTKYSSSFDSLFGGTSTMKVQSQLRHARENADVKAIFLNIDSPGGTTHGAFELADDLFKLSGIKPIIAYANGDMTSAALLFGSQAGKLLSTRATHIGSVGVRTVLYDTSKYFDSKGIRVISISSGKYKAVGEEGTEITADQVKWLQAKIDETASMFFDSVVRARPISLPTLKGLDADIFYADRAKNLGLIDDVTDDEGALEVAKDAAANPDKYLRKATATRPTQAKTTVAPENPARSKVMLNDQQLQQARQLTGVSALTAENADGVLLSTLANLNAPVPQKFAAQAAKITASSIDLLQKQEKLLPPQATALKSLAKAENVNSDGEVVVKLSDVLPVFEGNKPAGLVEEKSEAQKQHRTEPSNDDEKQEKSQAHTNRIRDAYALAPKTNGQN